MFGRKKAREAQRIWNIRSMIDFHLTVAEGLLLVQLRDGRPGAYRTEIARHMAAIDELEAEI